MTELSPAAQAVLTAATQAEYRLDPVDVPNEAARMASVVAPALRAVADQMKMPENGGLYGNAYWAGALACETKLRSIANELEAAKRPRVFTVAEEMTELSPHAQAVDRAIAASIQMHGEMIHAHHVAAAAIRATADQAAPCDYDPPGTALYPEAQAFRDGEQCRNEVVRLQLLAIADELKSIRQALDVADRQDSAGEEVEVAPTQSPELWRIMNRAAAFSSRGATTLEQVARSMAAAQLRAVADWLVPEEVPPHSGMRPGGSNLTYQETLSVERQRLRHVLLAEADRAEGRQ
jgi:hypothetical protein